MCIRDREWAVFHLLVLLRLLAGIGWVMWQSRMNLYTPVSYTHLSVSFDSRIKSDLFAREAARVLAANGITVHLFPELEPTPVLSYAVRQNRCQAGIMVTASHNPAKYNGYKCYGPDGCQMTDHDASEVTAYIRKVDLLSLIHICFWWIPFLFYGRTAGCLFSACRYTSVVSTCKYVG